MSPQARWTGRSDPLMAEIAEALEIPTDMVMGHAPGPGGSIVVLYTVDTGDENRGMEGDAFLAVLARDVHGVLYVTARQKKPGMLDGIRKSIEADVRRMQEGKG